MGNLWFNQAIIAEIQSRMLSPPAPDSFHVVQSRDHQTNDLLDLIEARLNLVPELYRSTLDQEVSRSFSELIRLPASPSPNTPSPPTDSAVTLN